MARLDTRFAFLVPLAAISFLACGPTSNAPFTSRNEALTTSAPSLGAAASFAVLASTAVTCTGATIAGNVGVSPGNTVTQTSCPITGMINAGGAAAAVAHTDFLAAYDQFSALPCDQALATLDGLTLSPGVYCFDAAATSTGGVLTLDGPANGLWIFKIGILGTGALTGTNFSVVTPGGAPPPCGSVYWWAAEGVTMTDSQFVGTILAGAATTLTRGTFDGNAYAKAAVTVTGTVVTACALGGGAPSCSDDEEEDDEEDCECTDDDRDDEGHHSSRMDGAPSCPSDDGEHCECTDEDRDDEDHHSSRKHRVEHHQRHGHDGGDRAED